jgi:hypothetical protein
VGNECCLTWDTVSQENNIPDFTLALGTSTVGLVYLETVEIHDRPRTLVSPQNVISAILAHQKCTHSQVLALPFGAMSLLPNTPDAGRIPECSTKSEIHFENGGENPFSTPQALPQATLGASCMASTPS